MHWTHNPEIVGSIPAPASISITTREIEPKLLVISITTREIEPKLLVISITTREIEPKLLVVNPRIRSSENGRKKR